MKFSDDSVMGTAVCPDCGKPLEIHCPNGHDDVDTLATKAREKPRARSAPPIAARVTMESPACQQFSPETRRRRPQTFDPRPCACGAQFIPAGGRQVKCTPACKAGAL
jgi:hypothetical protein